VWGSNSYRPEVTGHWLTSGSAKAYCMSIGRSLAGVSHFDTYHYSYVWDTDKTATLKGALVFCRE